MNNTPHKTASHFCGDPGVNAMDEIGYCGLDCTVCVHARKNRDACAGCHQGGGAEDCYQRKCCEERSLDGCWECDEFPCNNGFFADDAWKGLCTGFCYVIKEVGKERFSRLVRKYMGDKVELGDYRYKKREDIVSILITDE